MSLMPSSLTSSWPFLRDDQPGPCTGDTAVYCDNCGTCICLDHAQPETGWYDHPDCKLHGVANDHNLEPACYDEAREMEDGYVALPSRRLTQKDISTGFTKKLFADYTYDFISLPDGQILSRAEAERMSATALARILNQLAQVGEGKVLGKTFV